MKIEIDCTWEEGKKKAKVTIHFDYKPKSLFAAKEEDLTKLHSLLKMDHTKKPSDLRPIREMAEKHPKSPYIWLHYHNALQVFERITTAAKVLETMKEKFPEEIFTKCLIAEKCLKEEKYEEFKNVFGNNEVLRGAFPKRRSYYFEEAMCFHNLWGHYHYKTGNEEQANKHGQLFLFIANSAKNFLGLAPAKT